jgi:hypothetical protein
METTSPFPRMNDRRDLCSPLLNETGSTIFETGKVWMG